MMKIIIHPAVLLEATEARDYLNNRMEGLGNDLISSFEDALKRIQVMPATGGPVTQGVRRMLLRRFPYSVFYRVHSDRIHVLSLAHHRRRPGYWKDREGN